MNIKKIILLPFILIIAAVLRIYNLAAISLWHDEAFSGLLMRYDLGEMLYRIGLDVHPPFYYLILRIWDFCFGNSLFSLRMFSVFFSILIILAVYLFVKQAFKNKKLALFSSVITALNCFQIQYAQEARMYTLGAFLIIISSYFLLRALDKGGKKSPWLWWGLYIVAVIAGIYTHYYIFFSIAAQALFVVYYLFKHSRQNFKLAVGSYLLIALSYIPWLGIFFKQLSQVQESYWIPAMNIWSIPCTFYKLSTGAGINASECASILIIMMIAIIAAIIYALRKNKTPAKWLTLSLLIIPFVVAIGMSLKTSIYLDRYFIFVSAFYIILICSAILEIKNKFIRNTLIIVAILGSLIGYAHYWNDLDIKDKPGMAGAAAYLNQEVKPDDKIYIGSSFVCFTFRYYNETRVEPLLFAPNELSHFSGTALLSPKDIIKNFDQPKKDDVVWFINTTGFGNYQPETPRHWIKQQEKGFQDAHPYQGWIIVTQYKVQ
ncbi:glycosyltransferase family 39 protein [Candidatus Parcubacteria bacterium]|nr:glycosyltransferase family 39 protein [Candidatus Parcubacteria bacterium]